MAAETRKEQIGFDAYDMLKQAEQAGQWRRQVRTAQPASRRAEADVARATYELESRTKDFES